MSRKALIQIRRGLEKDISTLAIGELGYCEDTKKLYIGTKTGNVLLAAAQAVGDMLKTIYDTNNNGKVDIAEVADKTPWNGITGKPSTFPPSAHTHTKEQISNFPSSLPADGGNADTVDGKHASDFAPSGYGLGTTCKSVTGDWDNQQITGFYMGSGLTNQPPSVDGSNSWWYVIVMQHNASPGWILQIATDFNNKATYRRAKINGTWSNWVQIANSNNIPTKLSQLQNDSNYLKKGVTWNELKGV